MNKPTSRSSTIQREVSKDLIARKLGVKYSSLQLFGAGDIKAAVNELKLQEEINNTYDTVIKYLNREN